MIDPLDYFWVALKASLFSTGGLGNLPSLHQDLLARHWATDRQFASSIAIGQLAPGPTGLWVVALGYLTGGFAGALIMTCAILLPPLLIIPLWKVHSRVGNRPAVRGFAQGLTIAVAGSVPMIVLIRVLASYGYNFASISVLVASTILLMWTRLSPLVVLALGGAAGIILFGR